MAKKTYIGVGDKAKKVKKIYVGVGGKARRVKKAYVGVNGVAKLVYTAECVWGDTTYTWNSSNSSCTATRQCVDCGITETANATITSAEKTAATCIAKGTTRYTATFASAYSSWTSTQTKDVQDIAIDSSNHSAGWNTPTYSWTSDYSKCTATRTCKNDTSHKETQTVSTTSKTQIAATCTTKGTTRYTADFTVSWASDQTKDVQNIAATGHTPGAAATCSSTQTCTVCGTQLAAKNPNNHSSKTSYAAVAPTCTTSGNYAYSYCSGCQKYYNSSGTETTWSSINRPATGHSKTSYAAKSPTCTTSGNYAYSYCSNCSTYFNSSGNATTWSSINRPATGHSKNYHSAVSPTCTASGNYAYYDCSNCSTYFNSSGTETAWANIYRAATGHSKLSYGATAPTCTTAGNYAYSQCVKCSAYFNSSGTETTWSSIYRAATGHGSNYVTTSWSGSNSSDGCTLTATWKCSVCDAVTGGPTTINPDTSVGLAPTCTTDGWFECYAYLDGTKITCPYCHVIDETGHDMRSNNDYEAPTCEENGQYTSYSCANGCGHTTGGGTIPALDHQLNITEENIKEATCTEDGSYDFVGRCIRCDYWEVTDHVVVEALGHNYEGNMNDIPPTCTANGKEETETCTRCGDTIGGATIPATGHDWEDATCTEPKTCSNCGKTSGSALGHDWGDWEIWIEGSCDEMDMPGERRRWCQNCNEEDVDENYRPDHDWQDATCTEPETCSNCGATRGSRLGHEWDAYPYYDPCKCSRCDVVIHSWEDCTCADCGDHDDSWIDDDCYCSGCGEYFHQCTRYPCICEHCMWTDHVYGNSGDCIYGCGAHDDEAEGGGGNDECLIASTPILMADGTEKPIAEVKAGDMVKSFDLENNEYIDVEVLGSYNTGETTNWLVYSFDNGKELTIYNKHNIYCKENTSIKRSTYWKPDQTAISADGVDAVYIGAESSKTTEAVSRHTLLTENNLYFANGILCGHHPRAKYTFFAKGRLTATPEQLRQYMATNDIYQAMNGTENEEYRKEAAELLKTIHDAKKSVKDRNNKFAKRTETHKNRNAKKLDKLTEGKPMKLREMPEFVAEVDTFKQDIKAINKNIRKARKELNKIKEKYGVSTKTVYECWLEAYKLDMEYLKNKK